MTELAGEGIMLQEERRKRFLEAKHQIIDAANEFRKVSDGSKKKYRMRHINDAVCVARRNNLVDAKILQLAGYNA